MNLAHALGYHAATCIDDLAAQVQLTGRPIDCDPGTVPPEHADAECDLADELERAGIPVTPDARIRHRRLTAALRRMTRRTP